MDLPQVYNSGVASSPASAMLAFSSIAPLTSLVGWLVQWVHLYHGPCLGLCLFLLWLPFVFQTNVQEFSDLLNFIDHL
jgi:hypothetical protein